MEICLLFLPTNTFNLPFFNLNNRTDNLLSITYISKQTKFLNINPKQKNRIHRNTLQNFFKNIKKVILADVIKPICQSLSANRSNQNGGKESRRNGKKTIGRKDGIRG